MLEIDVRPAVARFDSGDAVLKFGNRLSLYSLISRTIQFVGQAHAKSSRVVKPARFIASRTSSVEGIFQECVVTT